MGRYRAIQRTEKRRPSCPSHCSLRGSSNQVGNHWRRLGEKVWLMLNTSFGSSQRTGHTEGGSFDVIHTNNGGGLDGQVTGRWRAAYRFSLLEIKRKWLCDWLGHKAWGKGSYLSEGTHHLQWCGMQEENRLSSGRGNIPFLICYTEDANRQTKGQVSLSAGSGEVMYDRSMGLVFIQVIFKIKETIDGI